MFYFVCVCFGFISMRFFPIFAVGLLSSYAECMMIETSSNSEIYLDHSLGLLDSNLKFTSESQNSRQGNSEIKIFSKPEERPRDRDLGSRPSRKLAAIGGTNSSTSNSSSLLMCYSGLGSSAQLVTTPSPR